jgi:hypothetical protein
LLVLYRSPTAPTLCAQPNEALRARHRVTPKSRLLGTVSVQRTCRSRSPDQAVEVSASEAFRSMCTAKQYRATATQYKERADSATAPDEKREFQDLERSFSTLADNEQWLSDNHDKTVHASERPSVSTGSGPMGQYLLLRTRGNSTDPHSLLKAAKPKTGKA